MPTPEPAGLRLGALVVLFRPSAEQLGHVERLVDRCPTVVAVDNSPASDPALQERLAARGVQVVVNANRGGIGGAFNAGLRRLRSLGATAAVLLDQDSTVPPGFFETLARTCAGLGVTDYIVGPRVFDLNAKRCVPAIVFTRFRLHRRRVDDGPTQALLPCSFLVSSGSVVSLSAYERIGDFDEDYFIDHVDSDYCLRATACGVTVAMDCAVTLAHQIGRMTTHRLLGLTLVAMNHPAARRYYLARNALRLTRAHGRRLPAVALVNVLTLLQLAAVVLFEADKLRKTTAVLAGWVDGALGRGGPLEACRPRLARWCAR